MTSAQLLAKLERYYDAAPRAAARTEEMPPLTLFVREGPGWPYYARPALGGGRVTARDVERVRTRQRELGVPEALEWVDETTPTMREAAEGAGLVVTDHPLMVLAAEPHRVSPPDGVEVRIITPGDDLALVSAVARVAFASPGTAVGPAGIERLEPAAGRGAGSLALERKRLRSGRTITAAALLDGMPVSAGSHQPVGDVTEIVGVATLPALRRRGLGAAVTALLVEDARQRGIDTIFLSAGDAAVERIYARLGFRRVGTACIASPE